jgi:hypothetical protein
VDIIRDDPVELTCRPAEFPDPTFLAWPPSDSEGLHILAPKD